MKKKDLVLNIVIAIECIIYIALTAFIFIMHKKINALETQVKQVQQKSTKAQNNYKQGSSSVAIKNYEQVIEKVPQDIDSRFRLATMLYSKGDAKAIQHFEYILEQEPDYVHKVSIVNWLAKLKKKQNTKKTVRKILPTQSQKEALQQLKQILKKNPNHPNKIEIQQTIHRWEKQYDIK